MTAEIAFDRPAGVKTPRVSVVCIFYNEERYLAEAIESVLAQEFQDFELLLVDDGSSDASAAIASDYAERFPANVFYHTHPGRENRGSSAARNLGLRHARGEFITWLDGDDRLRPGKLGEQVALLDAHPEVGVVAGGYLSWKSWAAGRDGIFLTGHVADRPSLPPETVLMVKPLGWAKNPTEIMIRRPIALAAGGFEESFPRLYDDQAFLAKVFLRTGVLFSPQIWMDYRKHDRSCTANISAHDYILTHRRFLDWFEGYVLEHDLPGRQQILGRIRQRRQETRSVLYIRVLWRLRRVLLRALSRIGFTERYRRDFITD